MPIRTRILRWLFKQLHSRLSFAHELVGRCAFGESWDSRRIVLLANARMNDGLVVDVGCGDGRLLHRLQLAGAFCVGVEPSKSMASRARNRGCSVVRARADGLPFADGSVATIVCTYPGPWITEVGSNLEFARVVAPVGCLIVLLGGDYVRGRGAKLRRAALQLVYGRREAVTTELTFSGFDGGLEITSDRWGDAVYWRGTLSIA
jgi:SAM-dependent methyltransferase